MTIFRIAICTTKVWAWGMTVKLPRAAHPFVSSAGSEALCSLDSFSDAVVVSRTVGVSGLKPLRQNMA
jgi:hypothetical protein